MTVHFYDSSAFAKLFINETGTPVMRNLYRIANRRVVSKLAFVEVHSAIRRLLREGKMSAKEADEACFLLQLERMQVEIVGLSDEIVARAQSLLNRYSLRSLDAIQIASAAGTSTTFQ